LAIDRSETIKGLISDGLPEIAYSVYKHPHNPESIPNFNKETQKKIARAVSEYDELLLAWGNKKARNSILSNNKYLVNFIKEYQDVITDEVNKRASEKKESESQKNEIIDSTISDILSCVKVIEQDSDIIKVISTELNRPDLGYAIYKTRCKLKEEEMYRKENSESLYIAVYEFMSYLAAFRGSLESRDVKIVGEFLNGHPMLKEFVKHYKESIEKLFTGKVKSKIVLTDMDKEQ